MLRKIIIIIILIIFIIYFIINWLRNLNNQNKQIKIEVKKEEQPNKITPLKVVEGAIDMGTSILRNNHTPEKLNIKQIEQKLEKLKDDSILKPIEKKKQIEYLYNQLESIKKEEKKNILFTNQKQETKKKIDKIEKELIIQKDKIEKEIKVKEQQKELQEKELISVENKENKQENNSDITFLKENTVSNSKNPEINKYKDYIKTSNTELKAIDVELKVVTEEINKNISNSRLELYKIRTTDLKERIKNIKKKYYDFQNSEYYYMIKDDFNLSQLDKYELLKSDEEVILYLNKCDNIFKKIAEKKATPKKDKQVENEVATDIEENLLAKKIKESEKEEKVKKATTLMEIAAASAIIKKDIENQKSQVIKINQRINSLPIQERKTKRFSFFDNFLGNTFKIGLSLLPFKFFRNRALGFLTSMCLLNNSIRSMRMVVTPELNIDYSEFNRCMKKQVDIINTYDMMCNDSLYQISCLKNEFVRNYGNLLNDDDVKKVYLRIESIENQVLSQREKLLNTKTKVKVKVKKLERYQNNH